ncbi:MAG: RnfABCDGE type electron transport complex subunit D [Pseudomonadota bacterium]|nr:RnfABCDGE type electron transport complex subunit D [Pseudomonadota bacterium]
MLSTIRPPQLRDARYFQIAGQAAILAIGIFFREFEITLAQIGAVLVTCFAVQWLGSTLNAMRFDWKSPLITTLSLSLLLRADGVWPLMLAAMIAIGSKFALRLYGKHIFNPANAGIVAMLLFSGAAWTTTGQWGTALWFAIFIAVAGSIVTWRASRLDIPVIFLATYAALLLGRAIYLGDPLSIPLLRLENGALILFAFFMISDPKTTPDGAAGRLVFAAAAAALAYVLQVHFFIADGLFYALFALTLVRPLIDRLNPANRYEWGTPPAPLHASVPSHAAPLPRPAPAE